MKVYIYQNATNQPFPDGCEFVARIRCAFPAFSGGKRVKGMADDWHPVIFHGDNYAALEKAATDWWNAEVAKAEAKEVSRAEQADRMRALAAAKKAARQ